MINDHIDNPIFDTAPDNRLLRSQTFQIVPFFYKQAAPPEHIYRKMCPNGSSAGEGCYFFSQSITFRWGEALRVKMGLMLLRASLKTLSC